MNINEYLIKIKLDTNHEVLDLHLVLSINVFCTGEEVKLSFYNNILWCYLCALSLGILIFTVIKNMFNNICSNII